MSSLKHLQTMREATKVRNHTVHALGVAAAVRAELELFEEDPTCHNGGRLFRALEVLGTSVLSAKYVLGKELQDEGMEMGQGD